MSYLLDYNMLKRVNPQQIPSLNIT